METITGTLKWVILCRLGHTTSFSHSCLHICYSFVSYCTTDSYMILLAYVCCHLCESLFIVDNVSQNEAADLSALFDVGGIVGMFTSC